MYWINNILVYDIKICELCIINDFQLKKIRDFHYSIKFIGRNVARKKTSPTSLLSNFKRRRAGASDKNVVEIGSVVQYNIA